jgi:hypothetical protein
MARGNAIPTDEIFARDAIVTLLIPKALRLAGELRRVYARVIQHTRGGYQLSTKWGLISGRFQHSQLNDGAGSLQPEIPSLTPQQAQSTAKFSLAKIVERMNDRGPVNTLQRAGRARAAARTNQRIEEENIAQARRVRARAEAGSPGTGDEIEAQVLPARRRRIGSSSPSAGPAARSTARTTARRGRVGTARRSGRTSARGRAGGRRQ